MEIMADSDFDFEYFASSSDESDTDIGLERVGGRVNPYQFEPKLFKAVGTMILRTCHYNPHHIRETVLFDFGRRQS